MSEQETTVEPVFLKAKDMPTTAISAMTVVKAVTEVMDPQCLEGVQNFRRVWHIYFKTVQGREDFLAQETVLINGKTVHLHDQHIEEKTYKLVIKGLPLSIQSKDIQSFLSSKGIKLSSKIMFSYIRDDDGVLTKFKDGDQYVYCYPSDAEIPRKQTICGHQCILFHRKTARSMFKSYKVGELQNSSKENEEDTSLPDETMDLAQLSHKYSVQEDTDPKSQYKHQAGEQQCLARKEDLPDKPSPDPSSTDEINEENEDSQNSIAHIDMTDNRNTLPRYKLTIKGLPLSIQNKDIKKFLLRQDIKLSSQIMHSYIKDDNGAYTTFKDGDRFVYYHPSGTSIPQEQYIRGHNCTLYTSSD